MEIMDVEDKKNIKFKFNTNDRYSKIIGIFGWELQLLLKLIYRRKGGY